MSRDRVSVDLCKAINGLEKVVLGEVQGSSAEWFGNPWDWKAKAIPDFGDDE